MWFRVSRVRVPLPTPQNNEGSGVSRSLFPFHTGVSPSGKARDFDSLIRWFESSRPSQANQRRRRFAFKYRHDPVAQSAEQLPFKQWVRGSNPRRVTTSEQAAYRLLRLFSKVRAHSFRCSSFPTANRFAGFAAGFGRGLESWCLESVYAFHVGAKSALLRRSFIPLEQKNVIRPLPCSSFPTAIRCAAVGGFAALRMRRTPCGCNLNRKPMRAKKRCVRLGTHRF